ncbi:MAG: hypothetical protein U9532_03150 ['Conium maculatum' witches'-broom phytoplasma]|nr:hypothetical protein ['Conium maculatum' witches'-broom phytoplasma]
MTCHKVDFPEPELPTIDKVSPLKIDKLILLLALKIFFLNKKLFVSF